jgi:hypothetical protein
VKWPTPPELLAIHASVLAAETAAFAPLFGNDPATEGAYGFIVGFVTGLPFCIAAMIRKARR